ncbi:unnamed protein product [Eruca vesicaria subsp. sativa]|uniref:ENT domain-containing protein n=1 Tax=Eruca vesicaria subsp. sativa TaxID=29727 RepID=A0ABC8JNW8_ERUVS|nr:unnamed protein product [Eruca vesicaria subsp. sativa]
MRFRKGSRVEVLNLKETPYGAWRTAEILSGNGHTYTVRYYSFGLSKDTLLEERVARKMIRPCPALIDVDRWQSGEVVEVLDDVFWKPATVVKELSGRYYVVRLLGGGASVEVTVHKVNLRARQAWQDERWVMISQVSCSVKSSTLTGSDVINKNVKPRVVSIRLVKRPSPCKSAESCTGRSPKKMRLVEEGSAAVVRVRSKRFSSADTSDASSVGSCSPIRYDENDDTSTSLIDVSSSQDADSYSSDAESSKGCREEATLEHSLRSSCRPELSTYRVTLRKLFDQGPLNWDKEASLTDLRLSLNISTDEHLMEIRNLTSAGGGITSLQCGISCYIFFFSKRGLIVICIDNLKCMFGNFNPYCDVLLLIVSLIFFCFNFGIMNYEKLQYIRWRIEFFFCVVFY